MFDLVDPVARDASGRSALDLALAKGDEEMAAWLRSHLTEEQLAAVDGLKILSSCATDTPPTWKRRRVRGAKLPGRGVPSCSRGFASAGSKSPGGEGQGQTERTCDCNGPSGLGR